MKTLTWLRKQAFRSILLLIFCLSAGGSTFTPQASQVWSNPVDITGGIGSNVRSFDAIVCDPYQNAHIFWADQSEDGAAIFYRNDFSGTWSFPVDVLLVDDASIYYLKTAVSPQHDTIHLTWVNFIFNATMYYSSAPLAQASNPDAWRAPVVIEEGVTNSDISVDPGGRLHLVYSVSDETGINNEVHHIVSEDDGMSWSEPDLVYARTFSQPSSIQVWQDIDKKGRIHLGLTLRSQEYGAVSEVGYTRSLDDGVTWDEYQVVQKQGTTFQGVAWIEPFSFGENEVHLTWHDPRRMHIYSRDGGETWSQPEEIMPLGGAFGGPNELTQDGSGTVHVVTAVSNGVFTAEWKNERWSAPQQIDARNIDPHGQHIAACGGNRLHIVYYDRVGDETVWYATRELRARAIRREPIPTPTLDPAALITPTIGAPEPTPTSEIDLLRATLSAAPPPDNISPSKTMSLMLSGVWPAAILIAALLVLALARMRR